MAGKSREDMRNIRYGKRNVQQPAGDNGRQDTADAPVQKDGMPDVGDQPGISPQEDLAQKQAFLMAASRINDREKMVQHEQENRAHDAEMSPSAGASMPGTPDVQQTIGEKEVGEAFHILLKYKEEKSTLEARIMENEEFWKMNHWEVMEGGKDKDDTRVKPKSAWLFNIINKHADAMDNYPEANILPRAKDDEEAAKVLSEVIPVIMEQNGYEDTYSDAQWYKAKNGTSVQGVFWNNDRANGLGDVEIRKIDLLNLFWKGGISDIQDSPNLFHVQMMDNREVKERYPEVRTGGTQSFGLTVSEAYQVGADTSQQTAVIDWYYKKRVRVTDEMGVPKTNTVLHYCKFCNGQVIYASENDPNYADRGWYDHGMYPFVFDTLYPIEGAVYGIGYIDIIRDDQLFIDKLQQAILESAVVNSTPRYFFRNDGSVNEKEFMDLSKKIIHVDGNLGTDSIRVVDSTPFNSVYETVYLNKIQELKDTSGNTAASQGQSSSVTSASGIASLQEAAGKLSRDSNLSSYRAYKKVVELVIELVRQFYNEPRCFRVVGETGENNFVMFDNTSLLPQPQGQALGLDLGNRLPVMDIEVKPQKKNAYSKEAQNQTALNLYNMGFFAANNADASLACLDMMDFDGIEKVRDKVKQNGTLMDMVVQLQQQLAAAQQAMIRMGAVIDTQNGTQIVPQIAGEAQQTQQAAQEKVESGNAGNMGGKVETSKGSLSTQAASAARSSASPR
jgi:hypothetical protein